MKTKAFLSLLLLFCLLSLTSCADESPYSDKTIFGMDTYVTLRLAKEGVDEGTLTKAAEDCAYIVAKNEKIMSSYDEEAHVYAFNNKVDMILEPAEALRDVIELSLEVSDATGGAYNPAIGALSELWNVAGGGPVPTDEDISDALSHTDTEDVFFEDGALMKDDEELKLDLGGTCKGYTAEELVRHLSAAGIPYGLVSMGGNIGVFGTKDNGEPFKVGLCDPDNTSGVVGYVHIKDGFIAVSGDYERFFEEDGERYHHILDPETGRPADSGLRSVAVWATDGAVADGLSTALYVLGEEEALELYRAGELGFEAVLITDAHEIVLTDGLAESCFELFAEGYTVRGAQGVEITLKDSDK